MSIRAMTADEIRAALRHSAQVCVEQRRCDWPSLGVIPQDGAFKAVCGWFDESDDPLFSLTPMHAATFLLLAAEAL